MASTFLNVDNIRNGYHSPIPQNQHLFHLSGEACDGNIGSAIFRFVRLEVGDSDFRLFLDMLSEPFCIVQREFVVARGRNFSEKLLENDYLLQYNKAKAI